MTRENYRISMKSHPLSVRQRLSVMIKQLLLSGLAMAFFSIACAPFPFTGAEAEAAQSSKPVDYQRLAGQWVRPDGGYVLKLTDIRKDGSLKAAYFNPRPINVSRAELHARKGKISLFVELRDINYPGSKYNLQYDKGADRLKGTYFQAVEGQTYDVEFLRMQ